MICCCKHYARSHAQKSQPGRPAIEKVLAQCRQQLPSHVRACLVPAYHPIQHHFTHIFTLTHGFTEKRNSHLQRSKRSFSSDQQSQSGAAKRARPSDKKVKSSGAFEAQWAAHESRKQYVTRRQEWLQVRDDLNRPSTLVRKNVFHW